MNDTIETAVRAREWLFKSRGQVFGPIPEGRLIALLESGEVGPETLIALYQALDYDTPRLSGPASGGES